MTGPRGPLSLKHTLRTLRESLHGIRGLRILALGLVVVACLIGSALVFSKEGIWGYRERQAQLLELEARNQRVKDENTEIFHRIQAFREDPLARERLVREQLGWARPNELVVEFAPEAGKTGK